jgi:spore coat polysaccharide biosynthesis protein SpsF
MNSNPNIVTIIAARMGSSRLPGKVLKDLAGEPMLVRVANRTRQATTLGTVVIATTVSPANDVIVNLCEGRNWPFSRGSETDALDHYYKIASRFRADIVVRITADCPLIDPQVIDTVVNEFLLHRSEVDYVSNCELRTFPRGLDTEVMSMDALERAWQDDHNPDWRCHVTQYIRRNTDLFRIRNVQNTVGKDYSYMRWTVDTPEDFDFISKIYNHFQRDTFGWEEVLHLLEIHPEWLDINKDIQQKIVQ